MCSAGLQASSTAVGELHAFPEVVVLVDNTERNLLIAVMLVDGGVFHYGEGYETRVHHVPRRNFALALRLAY